MYKFAILVVVCAGCQWRYTRDPIVIPELTDTYYANAVQSLEQQLADKPGDLNIIRLQLNHYEILGWPRDANKAVRRALTLGLDDPVIIDQCLDFYRTNERYAELLEVIEIQERMSVESRSLHRAKMEASIALRRYDKLNTLIRDYLVDAEVGDQYFVGTAYLVTGDTLLAGYHYLKAFEEDSLTEEFLLRVVPVWHALGLYTSVIELCDAYPDDVEVLRLLRADAHYWVGDTSLAKRVLFAGTNWESVQQLSEWYEEELAFDSAHWVLDLVEDTTHRKEQLMRHGDIDQDRGWLNTSLRYYAQILNLDSTYTPALEQIEIVNRKIAYLRRIREMERDIPTLELDTKGLSN